jgi:uncharacterized protein YkwD
MARSLARVVATLALLGSMIAPAAAAEAQTAPATPSATAAATQVANGTPVGTPTPGGTPVNSAKAATAGTASLSASATPAASGTPQVGATPTANATLTPGNPLIAELLHDINEIRVASDLLPLAEASELDAAAQAHSDDMVANSYLDHVGSDGSQPQDRAVAAGYKVPPNTGWIVVEVISAVSADPSGPVNWWIYGDPAVHGKVLLNPRWREIGGGYTRGGPYGNYWTVLVGCRPGVLPTVVLDGSTYQHTENCSS